jgi:hypothetical protein
VTRDPGWDDPEEVREARLAALREAMAGRHPATQHVLRWFDYGHLPEGKPRTVSAHCAGVAMELAETLQDGPELTAGLRKLLEAKDCMVRQAIADSQDLPRQP